MSNNDFTLALGAKGGTSQFLFPVIVRSERNAQSQTMT